MVAPSPLNGERAGVRGEKPRLLSILPATLILCTRMNLIATARGLRQLMPPAQRRLWRLLRDRRFAGYKIRREHPIGRYVLDFFCPEAMVSLELDGRQHGQPEQNERDELKEKYLLSRGIVTKRFWNWQVR